LAPSGFTVYIGLGTFHNNIQPIRQAEPFKLSSIFVPNTDLIN
jgi:hypothetical protein